MRSTGPEAELVGAQWAGSSASEEMHHEDSKKLKDSKRSLLGASRRVLGKRKTYQAVTEG